MKKIGIIFAALFFSIVAIGQEQPINYRIRHSVVIDPAIAKEVTFDSIKSWEVKTSVRVATNEELFRKAIKVNFADADSIKKIFAKKLKRSTEGEFIKKENFKLEDLSAPSRREYLSHLTISPSAKKLIDQDSNENPVYFILSVESKLNTLFQSKPIVHQLNYPIPVSFVKYASNGGIGLIYRVYKDENWRLGVANEWFIDI